MSAGAGKGTSKGTGTGTGIKIIADNKKARFDFEIIETFEAGLVLRGSEVKSLRNNTCALKDAYVAFRGHEAYLQNAHIPIYLASSYNNHEPERVRKLLLHEHELAKINAAITEKGLTCVPLKMYWKKGMAKVEIGIARGKKKGDKREAIKSREADRDIQRSLRRSR
ncbi:MAG: SsrA-binding protein SmpB [Calothrix sp. SM1_5_4]|nr:SsrA-binding protein SmpB [Calothrix sp. SM1_5_4]